MRAISQPSFSPPCKRINEIAGKRPVLAMQADTSMGKCWVGAYGIRYSRSEFEPEKTGLGVRDLVY